MIAFFYKLHKDFVFKLNTLLIPNLDFSFLKIVVSIPNNYTRSLSVIFITIFLSSASDLIDSDSSFMRLQYTRGLSIALNRSDSTRFKRTSKLGWPLVGFHADLRAKIDILLKSEVVSFQKCRLILMQRQNLSLHKIKSFLLL